MDKKFLNKVVDHIVSETKIVDRNEIFFPFSLSPSVSVFPFLPYSFTVHCKRIYGLNHDEIKYVWEEYSNSITYLIKNS